MKTLQHPLPSSTHTGTDTIRIPLLGRFFEWCRNQEENRILWIGVILSAHGCIITPLTLMFVMLFGNSMVLWPFAIAAIFMCLVVNLAALPTKITLPVFVLSLLIDAGIIIAAIAGGLSL